MQATKIALSAHSHNYLAENMTKRAAWAGPLHAIAFTIVFTHVPGLAERTWPYLVLFAMIAGSALRFLINHFAKDLVAHPVTRRIWRATFAFSSLLFAAGWAAYAGLLVREHGLNAHSVTAIVAACGVVAAAVPALAYDLTLLIAFVLLTMAPIAVSVAMVDQSSGLFPSLLVYALFMVGLSIAMNRFELAGQKQIETIHQQKTRLENLHATVATMIDSLDEAFLLVDEHGIFHDTNSPRARELFGSDPSGRPLHDVFKIPQEERATLYEWLQVCFERQMDFSALAPLGPARLHDSERGIDVGLRYRPMYGKDGRMEAIVVLAQDVSREVEAERTAKSNIARAEMIIQAFHNPKAFSDFLSAFENTLNEMRDGAHTAGRELAHALHTLKGAAMMFRAENLAEQIFKAENRLRDENPDVRALGTELADFFTGWKLLEEDFIRLLAQIKGRDDSKRTLHTHLQGYAATVSATARKLGKAVRLEVIPCPHEEDPVLENTPPVLNTFVHLFNNAVDHGLEHPDTREERGKPRLGRITVRTEVFQRRTKRFVRVLVSDDGAGINRAALKSALQSKGVTDIPSDPEEFAQLVFHDGVSSRSAVTKISGLGVGLSAVKTAAEDCGGSASVVKSDARGTDIEVLIPLAALTAPAARKNAA